MHLFQKPDKLIQDFLHQDQCLTNLTMQAKKVSIHAFIWYYLRNKTIEIKFHFLGEEDDEESDTEYSNYQV